jgi:RHS repeat-associated protein
VAADGLETTRASVIAGGTPLGRTVTARDDARRLTQATLNTDTDPESELDAQYAYDSTGHLVRQWGSGFAEEASGTQAYTYSTQSGLKTAEDLYLQSVGSAGGLQTTTTVPETTTTVAETTTTVPETTTTVAETTTTVPETTTTAPETTTTAPETTTTVAETTTTIAETTTTETTAGTITSVGRLTAAYTYTAAGRLQSASIDLTDNGDDSDAYSQSYSFDAAGNLTSVGEGTTLTYDKNGLATMTVGGSTTYFLFDAGQRWRTAQAPSNDPSDPDRTTYAYTGTGRLREYVQYAEGSPSVSATYTYDASGQRTESVVQAGGAETVTDFTYTGLTLHKLSATRTGGTDPGSWTITYLYDEYGRPYAGVYRGTSTTPTPAPVVFSLLTTDRGDVVALLDAEGAPFAAYRYDAWGNPLGEGNLGTGLWSQESTLVSSDLAAQIAQRQVLRYAGYCYDQESGMYYLSARHYDPATRQFLSKDLSRNDGEQSAYQYCLGNPVGLVDPSGYSPMKYTREKDANSWQLMQMRRERSNDARSQRGAGCLRSNRNMVMFVPFGDDPVEMTAYIHNLLRTNLGYLKPIYCLTTTEQVMQILSPISAVFGAEEIRWHATAYVLKGLLGDNGDWDMQSTYLGPYGNDTTRLNILFNGKAWSLHDLNNFMYGVYGAATDTLSEVMDASEKTPNEDAQMYESRDQFDLAEETRAREAHDQEMMAYGASYYDSHAEIFEWSTIPESELYYRGAVSNDAAWDYYGD